MAWPIARSISIAELTNCFEAHCLQIQQLQAMLHVPKDVVAADPELIRPAEEEIKKVTEETRQALEKLVQSKVAAAQPVRAADKQTPAEYIRYMYPPSQQGPAFNSGSKQRIICMVEVQKDPMELPFKTII